MAAGVVALDGGVAAARLMGPQRTDGAGRVETDDERVAGSGVEIVLWSLLHDGSEVVACDLGVLGEEGLLAAGVELLRLSLRLVVGLSSSRGPSGTLAGEAARG
ncbi:hypothetical protein [Sorangium atrum]|uniref:Uncharacterized protein n=1 Tax=Sorangium atrum TaxID=2995308 RepID=A0ABT5CCH4_9BACT|nr:hypothetical protein [Sorangium aterium]MDC0684133.1 hypothetical protein [Sorangium aterium]